MTTREERLQRDYLFPGPHEECDARIAELEVATLDHDAHRRQLQARNTELVEENRRLRAQVERQSRIMAQPCHACGAAGLPSDAPAAPPVPCPNGYLGCKCQAPMDAPAATEGER